MKIRIVQLIVFLAIINISNQLLAKVYLHQVIVLNEGRYDYAADTQAVAVTIGTYDPVTGIYSDFDTITEARFASDVQIHGDFIYVAADTLLIKYDKYSLERVATQTVKGIRKIALWNNLVLVSRGEFLATFNAYFQVFNQSDLSFIYEIDTVMGPKYASGGIAVIGDTAYVAVNNGFDWGNYVGYWGRLISRLRLM
ncbi:MAG: hypothetical protein IIA45_10935 [Bacteroidetes bacterium]|nr:hypothetical protein [Bacteroidota bacterium]